jgi:hypothetical protein
MSTLNLPLLVLEMLAQRLLVDLQLLGDVALCDAKSRGTLDERALICSRFIFGWYFPFRVAQLRDARARGGKLRSYKILKMGYLAYNPMRINIGSIGFIRKDDPGGITSPDYVVFYCKAGLSPDYVYHRRTRSPSKA